MMKKAVSLMLAMAIAGTALTGCSNSGGTSAGGGTASAAGAQSGSSGTPYTVKLAFPTIYGNPKNQTEVEAAVNKIALKKANVQVKFEPIAYAQWTQEMNLMLASNEKLDITVTLPNTYSTYVAQGKFVQMDDLLKQYGQGITKAFNDLSPDFLKTFQINGKTYGVAQMREFGSSLGVCMRKDIADEFKMDTAKTYSLDEMEAILKQIKAKYPNMTPVMPQTGGSTNSMISFLQSWDTLGDGFGVLMNGGTDTPLKVVDLYETNEYKSWVKEMRNWYQEGLIAKDSATTSDTAASRVKAGTLVGYVSNMKPGYEAQEELQTGKKMADFNIVEAHSSTSDVASFMYGIPVNCKDTVSTMKFLNLLYTDADIMNLMCYGIEGTDYEKTSTENVIKATSSPKWCQGLAWEMGNEFIAKVMEPNRSTIWEETKTFDKTNKKSNAMGFTFDETPVKTAVTSVTNVKNQYMASLEDGLVDPDTVLPKFIAALKANGMDTIVKEKQSQLNKWLEANNHSDWAVK